MKAILSVVGKDNVGILAKVSNECANFNANIVEVTQSVLNSYFVMVMIVNIDALKKDFVEFVDYMNEFGKNNNLNIHVMHEDIFNSMHKI